MEREHLPKSIRQMGDRDRNFKIYMEDYVHTFIRKTVVTRRKGLNVGILLGGIVQMGDEEPYFISGALDAPAAVEKSGVISFPEAVWDELMCRRKEYFPLLDVCGWYVRGEEDEIPDMTDLTALHARIFPKYGGVLYVSSGNDGYFMVGGGASLLPVRGYFVYYERNLEMQDYMILVRDGVGTESELQSLGGGRVGNPAYEGTRVTNSFRSLMREKRAPSAGVFPLSAAPNAEKQEKQAEYASKSERASAVVQGSYAAKEDGRKTAPTVIAGVSQDSAQNGEGKQEGSSYQGVFRLGLGIAAVLVIVYIGVYGIEGAGGAIRQLLSPNGQSDDGSAVNGTPEETDESEQDGENLAANGAAAYNIEITIVPGNIDPTEEPSQETEGSETEEPEADPTPSPSPTPTPEETEPTQPDETETPAPEETEPPAETEDDQATDVAAVYQEHMVMDGETLLGICIMYYGDGSQMSAICELNGIEDQDYIYEGQIIKLP